MAWNPSTAQYRARHRPYDITPISTADGITWRTGGRSPSTSAPAR